MHPALLIPIIGVSIPIVALIGIFVVKPWMHLQHRKLDLQAQITREAGQIDSARHERLEQRVRVLERIVTDRGVDLSDEIDRLRDAPLN